MEHVIQFDSINKAIFFYLSQAVKGVRVRRVDQVVIVTTIINRPGREDEYQNGFLPTPRMRNAVDVGD